jgi:hypothetical protein
MQPPSFADLYTPKLVTILREGYGWPQLRADAVAGLTVAIVALPLSMAIAIGSGFPSEGAPLHRDRCCSLISALLGASVRLLGSERADHAPCRRSNPTIQSSDQPLLDEYAFYAPRVLHGRHAGAVLQRSHPTLQHFEFGLQLVQPSLHLCCLPHVTLRGWYATR